MTGSSGGCSNAAIAKTGDRSENKITKILRETKEITKRLRETEKITNLLCETEEITSILRETEKITKKLCETEEIIMKISVRHRRLQLRESKTAEIKIQESQHVTRITITRK